MRGNSHVRFGEEPRGNDPSNGAPRRAAYSTPKLHDQLCALPWRRVRAGSKTRETANGREFERTVKCVSVDAGINFPHVSQAAQITRKSRPLGTKKWSTESVHIVTSLAPAQGKPELIGSLIRCHWGIENGLHCRDVTWREDSSQVRRGNAPRVMASLRIAITILRLEGETNLAKATRGARNYPRRALKLASLNIS